MTDATDGSEPRAVRHLPRHELLAGGIDLQGDEGVFARTAYPGLVAGTFRSNLVVMPEGHQSPPRTSDIEHVIVVLEGAFVFTIDGIDYRIEALDQLFVPVGVVWEYVNAAPRESSYLAIVGP